MGESFKNIRLGTFVLVSTVFLIAALYLIGNKRNLFGRTFRITASFYNVNGLMEGNNVRFAGINVGTVESVKITSDSTVLVVMVIENSARQFIKRNSVASVGTDGLMGNKLININTARSPSEIINEGDELTTLRALETDEMIRTLDITNRNIKVISSNLMTITDRINSKNALWGLMMDTIVSENLKSSIVNLKLTSNNSVDITEHIKHIAEHITNGKGSLGAIITDAKFANQLNQTLIKIERLSDSITSLSGDVSGMITDLRKGKGTAGVLLTDTSLVYNLNRSVKTINEGATNFNQNMEALKYSWPLKKYYRKKVNKAK